MKTHVIIGFLGTQLDGGQGSARWEKWRPTVSLAQHDDLEVSRFVLFHLAAHRTLLAAVSADIRAASPKSVIEPIELAITDPWDFEQVYGALHDYTRQTRFKPLVEDYWVHITTGTHVAQICLFLMVEARYIPGVLLQTSPPKRQKTGAAGSYALIDLDLSKYNQIAQRFAREESDAVAFLKHGIETQNASFNRTITEIERVAVRSREPMLLMGPTGAGKSFLAKRIYELKQSRHQLVGAFVEVNCATLRGDGAASALFGHIKGAFTGAAGERAGLLRSAHQGLLFLDEIGELGLDEQAMLLKAIEDKRFLPVGSDREVASDFQLIAGTNRDLRQAVARGRFRDDLLARINLWTYTLPGLAERREDIAPNLDYLLSRLTEQPHSLRAQQIRFTSEARTAYLRFAMSDAAHWGGNFRDLGASVTRLATLAEAGRITETGVAEEIARLRQQWQAPRAGLQDSADATDLTDWLTEPQLAALDLFDRVQLEAVIRICRQSRNQAAAGRTLFAASRVAKQTVNDSDRLRKYLAKFGLSYEAVATSQ